MNMANQSFPPVSLLRGLRTLRLNLDIPAFKDALDQEALEDKIKNIVTTGGVKFVEEGTNCDALLNAKVMVIATASHADGSPFSLAYVVRLTLLTTVAYYPNAELFIVFDDFSFGSTGPMVLSKMIAKHVGDCAQVLADRLKPVPKPAPVPVPAPPADATKTVQKETSSGSETATAGGSETANATTHEATTVPATSKPDATTSD